MLRKIALVFSLLVLLASSALGLYNGIVERAESESGLQLSIAYGVLAYGVLGLLAAIGLMTRKRWALIVGGLWAVVIVYVASTAALAYAPADATIGSAVAGGLGTAAVAAIVIWTIRDRCK